MENVEPGCVSCDQEDTWWQVTPMRQWRHSSAGVVLQVNDILVQNVERAWMRTYIEITT